MNHKVTTVNWLTISRMPYFDDLFTRLAREPLFLVKVFYAKRNLAEYPLKDTGHEVEYQHRYCENFAGAARLLWEVLTNKSASWIVGGWGTPIYAVSLTFLALLGKKYWIFTDAPKPGGRSKSRAIRFLRPKLLAFWFARATAVLGTGQMALDRLRDMGVSPSKLTSLPYPLDEDRFLVGEPYRRGEGLPIVIVCSGRLVIADKRTDLAIRAFAALTKKLTDCEVVLKIAGTGRDEQQLKHLCRELGIENSVHFLGWMSQSELSDLYRASHVYLHPADFEPYGVTVVEALYSGLFTVASDGVASAVELIQTGHNGLLFRAGNVSALEAHLEQACQLVSSGSVRKDSVRQASLKWSMDNYLAKLLSALA